MEQDNSTPQATKNYKLTDEVREYYKQEYRRRCEEDPDFKAKRALQSRIAYYRRKEAAKADPNYVARSVGRPRKYIIIVQNQ